MKLNSYSQQTDLFQALRAHPNITYANEGKYLI